MQWSTFEKRLTRFSADERERVRKSFELGKELHKDQKRKSGEPYFTHPIAVAEILLEWGADADTIIAALLHDTVEDTDITLEEIEEAFNGNVALLIKGMTKLTGKELDASSTITPEGETIRKIFTLIEQDVRIVVMKLADRLHNMRTIEGHTEERRREIAKQTLEIYVKTAEQLNMQDAKEELERLCLQAMNPQDFAELETFRKEKRKQADTARKEVEKELFATAPELRKITRFVEEEKSWQELQEQMEAELIDVYTLSSNIFGIVCKDTNQCYQVLGVLHQRWKRMMGTFRDYFSDPLLNGYRGLHTTIFLDDGRKVRCRIRTEEMEEYNHRGITQWCFDSTPKGMSEYLPWLQRLQPLIEDTSKRSEEFMKGLQTDVLGTFVTVYGSGGRVASIPSNSTVLDAAFYLYHDKAATLQSIRINGEDVSLFKIVEESAVLDISFSEHETFKRKWLQWVNTGIAKAMIRKFLECTPSQGNILQEGKSLLQAELKKYQYGYIEEINKSILLESIRSFGFSSIDEGYRAIASGHLDPAEVFEKLSGKKRKSSHQMRKHFLRFSTKLHSTEHTEMEKLLDQYADSITKKTAQHTRGQEHVRAVLRVDDTEREALTKAAQRIGPMNWELYRYSFREIGLLVAVIVLWSLNPVFARWLMEQGMPLTTLFTSRLIIFSIFTGVFFVIWRLFTTAKLYPIRHLPLIATIPTIGNAATAFFTYGTLQYLPPSFHLTIMRLNTILLPFLSLKDFRLSRMFGLSAVLTLGAACVILLLSLTTFDWGIALSLLTLFSYLVYSLSTEQALRVNHIDSRYPYLLLMSGFYLGIIGLILLPFQPLSLISGELALYTFLYTLLCVCVPHASYQALLKTTRFNKFTDLLLLEVPLAALFEHFILGLRFPILTYTSMALILLVLFFVRYRTVRSFLAREEVS